MSAERLAIDGGTPVRSTPLPFGRGITTIGTQEEDAVLGVLRRRALFRYGAQPSEVAAFETDAASLLGTPHAIAVSSGTASLRCALAALGIGPGDEVIVPAFTFVATVNAVVTMGAIPVYAEVDESLGLDPARLVERLTPHTVAIIAVHLMNSACDLEPILALAASRGIPVIEDAAQAFGASLHGQRLGTFGALGCYSLQQEKNITAGEGGLVVSADSVLALRASRFQDQGGPFVTGRGASRGTDLMEPFVGENLRLGELAGAVARVQLTRLDDVLSRMRSNAAIVRAGVGAIEDWAPRRVVDDEGSGWETLSWFLPTSERAVRVVAALSAEGAMAVQLYDGAPVYANPALRTRRTASPAASPWLSARGPIADDRCPATENLVARSVTVGIGAALSPSECDELVAIIRKVATALRT